MPADSAPTPRPILWGAGLFAVAVFLVSWWQWWTFQYGTFDLAFYVQALWLALRGKWMVSLLNVPLMGNHAEPIVFLLAPVFAIFPHPMTLVAVQTLAFATMPFTAWRIARRLGARERSQIDQTIVALFQQNPGAFAGNINRLRAGALVRLPRRPLRARCWRRGPGRRPRSRHARGFPPTPP